MSLSKLLFSAFACLSFGIGAATNDKNIELLHTYLDKLSCNELRLLPPLARQLTSEAQASEELLHFFIERWQSKQSACAAESQDIAIDDGDMPGASVYSVPELKTSNQNTNLDTTPPELLSVSISEQTLDVSDGPKQVEVVIRAKDPRGMGQSILFAYAPEGYDSNFNQLKTVWNTTSVLEPRWQPTAEPEVYQAKVVLTFDAASPAGVWNIRPLTLADGLGNETPIITKQQMLDWGFVTDLTVINERVIDVTPPELLSITLSKQQLDTTVGAQQVEVVLRAKDPSGMGQSVVYGYAPEGFGSNFNQMKILWDTTSVLEPRWQPTAEPEVYQAKVVLTFDATSPAGVWDIRPFTLADGLGNETPIITKQQMLDWGFVTDLTVINERDIDVTPPELLSITLSKQQLDTTVGAQQVEVVLRAKDPSGMGQSVVYGYAPEGFGSNFNQFKILWDTTSVLEPRWQPTAEPEVYQATVTLNFDATSPAGVWNIRPFTLADGLGNETSIISRQQMLDWGFSTDLFVNAQPDPDIAVSPTAAYYYIAPTTQGTVSFAINAEQGASLPQSLTLRFNASSGLQYRGLRIEGAGSYSLSCSVVNSAGTCRLGLPSGVSALNAVFSLETLAEVDYPFSLSVSSGYRELNYQNNSINLTVTGIKPQFTATARVEGNGVVNPASQQILLDERGAFTFSAANGHTLQEFTGCGATREAEQLVTAAMTANCELTVRFSPIVYDVNLPAIPENGEVSCDVTEAAFGSTLTCKATPAKGFKFVGWKNSQCQGQARICTLAVDGDISLQPEFAPITQKRKSLPIWLFVKP